MDNISNAEGKRRKTKLRREDYVYYEDSSDDSSSSSRSTSVSDGLDELLELDGVIVNESYEEVDGESIVVYNNSYFNAGRNGKTNKW